MSYFFCHNKNWAGGYKTWSNRLQLVSITNQKYSQFHREFFKRILIYKNRKKKRRTHPKRSSSHHRHHSKLANNNHTEAHSHTACTYMINSLSKMIRRKKSICLFLALKYLFSWICRYRTSIHARMTGLFKTHKSFFFSVDNLAPKPICSIKWMNWPNQFKVDELLSFFLFFSLSRSLTLLNLIHWFLIYHHAQKKCTNIFACVRMCICIMHITLQIYFSDARHFYINGTVTFKHVVVVVEIVHFRYVTPELIEFLLWFCFDTCTFKKKNFFCHYQKESTSSI